jgi:hypothetical protein
MAERLPVIHANGWLADRFSTLSLWKDDSGTLMEVPAAGRYWIAADGSAVTMVSRMPDSDPALLGEALLGPPLVLALALRDTWCLHASAIIFGNCLVALLGESGQGKSTLAAHLAQNPGWRLVADDILPVSMNLGRVSAWTRFPQLKLPVEAQPGPGLPEELSISTICLLSNVGQEEMPALQRLSATQSVPVFLGHTAGTRLFDAGLLTKHLNFCTSAACRVPVYRLSFPRRLDALPEVRQLLEGLC